MAERRDGLKGVLSGGFEVRTEISICVEVFPRDQRRVLDARAAATAFGQPGSGGNENGVRRAVGVMMDAIQTGSADNGTAFQPTGVGAKRTEGRWNDAHLAASSKTSTRPRGKGQSGS